MSQFLGKNSQFWKKTTEDKWVNFSAKIHNFEKRLQKDNLEP
jgi:hypothetical protein